jgi:hypothetical protein
MADDVKLPPGYKLEEDVKLPPGYTLEGSVVTDPGMYDNPENVPQKPSKEGIPVYLGKPVSAPMYNYPVDPKTGQRSDQPQQIMRPAEDKPLSGFEKAILSPLDYFQSGMTQLGRGLQGVTHPQGGEQMAGATSDILRGGMQTLTPFAAPEMVMQPLASATGLLTFGATQQLLERTAQHFGLPEGYSRLAGDLAGIYGGQRVYGWLADMAKIPDTKVADSIYQRLEAEVERLKDPSLSRGEKAAAKAGIDAMISSLRHEEGWKFPALFPNPNQTQADAYQYMRRDVGMQPDAGMATGSPMVQGAQKLSGFTPAGAYLDAKSKASNTEAFRSKATSLVAGAMPEEGPSRDYYADFERRVNDTAPVEVPLSIAKDGSQISGNVKAPVDIRDLKYELQPLFDKMQFMPMADRSSSYAYSALDALLKSPDFISAPTAEWGLSNFKKAARTEQGGIAEALAKTIIPKLQATIDGAVESHSGQEALTALQKGRTAAAKEAGAEWLVDQFKLAKQEGGFDHAKRLWNSWAAMKDTAKRTMFTPAQIAELDKFFLGLKMHAETPNPSGTALVGTISSQAGALGTAAVTGQILNPLLWLSELSAAAVSKLLRSDKGVELLTQGLRIPRTSERGRFIEKRLKQILGNDGKPPEQGPPSGGGPGGGQPQNPARDAFNRAKESVREFLDDEEGSSPRGSSVQYLYHGTSSQHVKGIKENGLVGGMSGKGIRKSRVYVTPFPEIAWDEAYNTVHGDEATGTKGVGGKPVLVRIYRDGVTGLKLDSDMGWTPRDKNSFTSDDIDPNHIAAIHTKVPEYYDPAANRLAKRIGRPGLVQEDFGVRPPSGRPNPAKEAFNRAKKATGQ